MMLRRFLLTVVSIVFGFMIGAIILLATGFNPIDVYKSLLDGIISKPKYIAWTIVYATPVLFTGLSVAFAFRTGLFNIGAEGQYIMGSLAAVLVGVLVKAPPGIHAILCLIAGVLAGGLYASISGLMKARKKISEVITCIMLNWAALFFSNYMINRPFLKRDNAEGSKYIADSAKISIGFLKDLLGSATKVNWGIIIGIFVVFLIYFIINKTTLGYKLRAVGFNKDAAIYGGVSVTSSIVTSMAIAGGLAGLAGAIQITGVQFGINLLADQEGYGFNGLSVAMIGGNNPFGVLASSIFFGALQYGGTKLNAFTPPVPTELISITIGSIIYAIAMPNAINQLFAFFKLKKGGN